MALCLGGEKAGKGGERRGKGGEKAGDKQVTSGSWVESGVD